MAVNEWAFERIATFPHDGGSYIDGLAPWRLVLHTTEGGGGVFGQAAFMAGTGNYAHVVADPKAREVRQLVSFARSVTTAKNKPGGVETNRAHAVQVEIVWYAPRIRELTHDDLEWLGREVVAPICRAVPIAPVGPPRAFVGPEHGFIARPDAPQRLTFDEWRLFNGVCGHQHVPENDHWDPGALDIERVLDAARVALGAPNIGTDEEGFEDMTPETQNEIKMIVQAGVLELLDHPDQRLRRAIRQEAEIAVAESLDADRPTPRRARRALARLIGDTVGTVVSEAGR